MALMWQACIITPRRAVARRRVAGADAAGT